MTIYHATVVVLVLVVGSTLGAQAFSPVEFFGEASFAPDGDDPRSGTLHDDLKGDPPDWISFAVEGEGRARDYFRTSADGLEGLPDEDHRSCEAMLDVGVGAMDGKVTLASLEKGAAFAWDLRDFNDPETIYLVNLMCLESGAYKLSVQVRTPARYVDIPASKREIDSLDFPVEFGVALQNGRLTAEVGDIETAADIEFGSAATVGLAVTHKPVTMRDLKLDLHLHTDWIDDAAVRLQARRTLMRLREVATLNLLSGIEAFAYPGAAEQLKQYSEDQRSARKRARTQSVYDAVEKLLEIAKAHEDLSLAQHEAGVAALLAGHPAIGYERLQLAVELKPEAVSRLAFAEACRRVGEYAAAAESLDAASDTLPKALEPDLALIRGRLLADRGDIEGAYSVMWRGHKRHPGHSQLAAFAESARTLLDPPVLKRRNAPGPLGLTIMSDLDWATIGPLLEELEPYIEQIRAWLPGLEDELHGRIAIFSGPVDYLNTALLVAGDNLDHVAGMYMPHGINGEPTVMTCHAFGEDELLRTMVHELWHLALASTGRDAALPRWLNEGMAVFLSAGVAGDEGLEFNELPSEFRGVDDAGAALKLELFERALNARPQSFYVPGEVRRNYLAAWAVVWYFAVREDDRKFLAKMLEGDEAALAEPLKRESLGKAIAEAMVARIK